MKKLLLCCFVLCLPLYTFAQIEWETWATPPGFTPKSILAGPQNSLFVVNSTNFDDRIYRLYGDSEEWQLMPAAPEHWRVSKSIIDAEGTLYISDFINFYKQGFGDNYWVDLPPLPHNIGSLIITSNGTLVNAQSLEQFFYLLPNESEWQVKEYDTTPFPWPDIDHLIVGPEENLFALIDRMLIHFNLSEDDLTSVFTASNNITGGSWQAESGLWIVTENNRLFNSSDLGENWTQITTLPDMVFDEIQFGANERIYLKSALFEFNHYLFG